MRPASVIDSDAGSVEYEGRQFFAGLVVRACAVRFAVGHGSVLTGPRLRHTMQRLGPDDGTMTESTHHLAAIAWLSIAALALPAWIAYCWSRTSFSLVQLCLSFLATLLVRLLWGTRRTGKFPLAKGQGVVVVCNHRSSIDPFFFQTCLTWPSHWMVAKEYFSHAFFRWFLKQAECIPTNRGGVDTAATKGAIRLAEEGGVVGMFPEGRINMTDALMLPGRPGAVLVALKARVPILPCYIQGSPFAGTVWSPLTMTAKVQMKFGKLIDLSPYFGRESDEGLMPELMLRCLREIGKLAGHDDYEPQLAGKKWKPSKEEVSNHVAALTARQAVG